MRLDDDDVQEIGDATPGLVPRVPFDVEITLPRDGFLMVGDHPRAMREHFQRPVNRRDVRELASLIRNSARRSVAHDSAIRGLRKLARTLPAADKRADNPSRYFNHALNAFVEVDSGYLVISKDQTGGR